MANLVDWILEIAAGEEIEAVVIGRMGWEDYNSEKIPQYDSQPKGKLLSWSEARPQLDYDFYEGYGSPGCNAIYAWTPTKVIAIAQYDGSTWPYSIPRNPTNIMPEMQGGG